MSSFDPYYKWLGISPKDQPPNHYRLLGIDLFESDPDVIAAAADKQMVHVRSFQTGEHSALSQKMLNEISAARVCLLDPQKKAEYDAALRALSDGRKASTRSIPPVPPQNVPPPWPSTAVPVPFNSQLSTPPNPPTALPSVRTKLKKSSGGKQPWLVVGMIGAAAALLIVVLAVKYGRNGSEVASAQPKADHKAVNPTAPEPTPKPETTPQEKPEPPQQPTVDPKAEPKAEPPKPEPEAEPKTETKPEPTSEPILRILEPKPEPSKEKLAPPDEAAQKKVLETIREVYKDEYTNKAALAKKLVQKADETNNDPVARFVLLHEATDVATEAGQGELAFQTIDALTSEYTVSGPAMKAEVIDKGVKVALPLPQKEALARAALQVIDDAIAEDNFDVAKQMGRQASQLTRLSKDGGLVQEIAAKIKEVDAAAKAYADVEAAMPTLKETPTDPAANLIVGKYFCFTKNDWNKGLPMLALGSDPTLKALAERDMRGAATTQEQVKLGDAWWEMGGRQRSAYWYDKALYYLSGLEKDRARQRIGEANDEGRGTRWFVIFRSANPKIWNPPMPYKNGQEIAVPVASVPMRVKYLRLSCEQDFVIVPITKDKLLRPLTEQVIVAEGVGWFGEDEVHNGGHHFGIFNRVWNRMDGGTIQLGRWGINVTGWGFGHAVGVNVSQGYCWAGKPIPSTVYEIAVKVGPLTEGEAKSLLVK